MGLLLAALATPLVVSVHSVVSLDFAVSIIPGWHSTIFPPYFVAGAIFSGMAMVLTLLFALVGGMLFLPDGRQNARTLLLLTLAMLLNATVLLAIMFVVSVLAPLQGFFSESMASLWYQYPRLDFQQMLYATAVISHLGLLFILCLDILGHTQTAAETPMGTQADLAGNSVALHSMAPAIPTNPRETRLSGSRHAKCGRRAASRADGAAFFASTETPESSGPEATRSPAWPIR